MMRCQDGKRQTIVLKRARCAFIRLTLFIFRSLFSRRPLLRDIAPARPRALDYHTVSPERCVAEDAAATALECNKEKLHCRLADIHHIAGGDAVFISLLRFIIF